MAPRVLPNPAYRTEEGGSDGEAFDLYSGGGRFESRPGHRVPSREIFAIFLGVGILRRNKPIYHSLIISKPITVASRAT
jgi:hypothetical protein